jgi:hypothetical protein
MTLAPDGASKSTLLRSAIHPTPHNYFDYFPKDQNRIWSFFDAKNMPYAIMDKMAKLC